MNNMFEGAKFGDKYITRDGLIAIFVDQNRIGNVTYICQPKGTVYCERTVNANGMCVDDEIDGSDIVGKYNGINDRI